MDDQSINYNQTALLIDGKSLPVAKINGEWACYVQQLPPFTTVPIEIKEGAVLTQGLIYKDEDGIVKIENHRYTLTFSKVSGGNPGLI